MVDFPLIGAHPGVVVSRESSIPVRTNVTLVLVTSQARGGPAEVPLNSEVGLDHPSVANCDEIYTIRKDALVQRLGQLRFEELRHLDRALRVSLGLI